jgi:hypothetical protein
VPGTSGIEEKVMNKIDLKKEWKELYRPSARQVSMVDVPPFNYLMIDGRGDPNITQAYKDAVETLYTVAYTLKFMLKKGEIGQDYVVMPLQGLWWVENMADFSAERKGDWEWTMMILQPPPVTEGMVAEAVAQAAKKKNPPALDKVRLESLHEGSAAQIMHIGPYADEAPNIAKIHQFIIENGAQLRGKHHEIYLSDPRRAAPEKLKTIIRQPFEKV